MNRLARACAVAGLLLAGCERSTPTPERIGHYTTPTNQNLPPQALPGGATTFISLKPGTARSADAFSQPASNLPASERGRFMVGNSFFRSPWVTAPASVSARDGLGPLFAAAACQDCHVRDGRGFLPQDGDGFMAATLRIARRDSSDHPVYGSHLHTHAIAGITPEVSAGIDWIASTATLADGTAVPLRRPAARVDRWHYGPPGDAVLGLRIAPPMIGLGLLEAIPQAALEEQARRHGGRLNRVRDAASGETVTGRFGWKAAQPTVRQQSLHAFLNDMGITSSLFPHESCTPKQAECKAAARGGQPELENTVADAVVFYARHLATPARRDHDRPDVKTGEALFLSLGCAGCHRPQWITGTVEGSPELSAQTIYPYTDLLLHDMGPDLADGLREGEAGSRDWRTPPLWGLGHTNTVSGVEAGYLHDGRARDFTEAILWHGGEAQAAREAFASLSKEERRKLIRFLASL